MHCLVSNKICSALSFKWWSAHKASQAMPDLPDPLGTHMLSPSTSTWSLTLNLTDWLTGWQSSPKSEVNVEAEQQHRSANQFVANLFFFFLTPFQMKEAQLELQRQQQQQVLSLVN